MIVNINCPKCGQIVETYRNPFPTTDVVVFRDCRILLINRKNPPYGWALPGGFIDYGESAEAAAARELHEETGLTSGSLELLGVYFSPGRDPRFHTISVVYMGTATGDVVAGDDATEARWFSPDNLPNQIAFDHRQIISDAMTRREST